MNRLHTILLFCIGLILETYSQSDTLEKILITQIEFGRGVSGLNQLKVEAAMDLVARFSQKYQIIPFDTRDSIAKVLEKKGIEPTPYLLGKEFGASKLLLIRINRLANILRTDLISFNLKDSTVSSGKGYAQIRYFLKEKNEPILDPALLTATQRAFADLLHKPDLYQHLEGSFKVKPAPTLVIGSINYIESDSLARWDIFRKKQVTSYFAVETISETARSSADFIAFDIATRDSIYAFFNLYEPENYSPPNIEEIRALLNFEIDYYISGEFFWDENKAKLRLYLCKITEEGLEIIDEADTIVEKDNLDSYENSLKLVTRKLLNISEN